MTPKTIATRLRVFRQTVGEPTHIMVPVELVSKAIEALERYDPRVTELLEANTKLVLEKRQIRAHFRLLATLVQNLRTVLRTYAQNHRDKIVNLTDPKLIHDTIKKADRNEQLADQCDETLLWTPEE